MERVGAARELVLGYVEALNAVDEAVRAAIPSLERLADVLGLVRSHRIISRSGRIGPYSYTVHGAGCRFVSDNGTEVDVDFAAEGSEIFDLWRPRFTRRSRRSGRGRGGRTGRRRVRGTRRSRRCGG
ncbi:DUF6896 domain-containing protein [Streptomyces sp. NPDC059513]|uniref:DUF6896 domain-containing protein n=1 Tax=unclassified Streptomyces TaxID=2593676 RepID=UPI0036B6D41A